MGQATTDLKEELQKSLRLLQTLRDEVRVKLHLGSLEVIEEWKRLEPHLRELEATASELSEQSHAAVTKAVERLSKVRAALLQPHPDQGGPERRRWAR